MTEIAPELFELGEGLGDIFSADAPAATAGEDDTFMGEALSPDEQAEADADSAEQADDEAQAESDRQDEGLSRGQRMVRSIARMGKRARRVINSRLRVLNRFQRALHKNVHPVARTLNRIKTASDVAAIGQLGYETGREFAKTDESTVRPQTGKVAPGSSRIPHYRSSYTGNTGTRRAKRDYTYEGVTESAFL